MEEDYAHDTCSMFVNGLYKYEPVIKMFKEHRQEVLREALRRILKMEIFSDYPANDPSQWIVDGRKEEITAIVMADDLDPNE